MLQLGWRSFIQWLLLLLLLSCFYLDTFARFIISVSNRILTWNSYYHRLGFPLLPHARGTVSAKRAVTGRSWTPSFHPSMSQQYKGREKLYTIKKTPLSSRQWSDGDGTWIQRVSSEPSSRADVIQLEKSLNTELQLRRARQHGICSVRSNLYSQCFGKNVAGGSTPLWFG